jgi:hypothetical protein
MYNVSEFTTVHPPFKYLFNNKSVSSTWFFAASKDGLTTQAKIVREPRLLPTHEQQALKYISTCRALKKNLSYQIAKTILEE